MPRVVRVSVLSGSPPTKEERRDRQHEEHDERELRNRRGGVGERAKPKHSGNDGDDEEDDGSFQHDCSTSKARTAADEQAFGGVNGRRFRPPIWGIRLLFRELSGGLCE